MASQKEQKARIRKRIDEEIVDSCRRNEPYLFRTRYALLALDEWDPDEYGGSLIAGDLVADVLKEYRQRGWEIRRVQKGLFGGWGDKGWDKCYGYLEFSWRGMTNPCVLIVQETVKK